MPALVSFDDAAQELGTSTEEVSKLVSSGKLQTGEEGGLVMITRESLDAHKVEKETVPLDLTEPEPEPEAETVPTIALAAEEAGPEEQEAEPTEAAAPEAVDEKTESIFGDEFELETFEEATVEEAVLEEAPGEELAELEEAAEELGAEEVAELTAREGAPARLRAVAARPETSTAMTVVVVVTFVLLLFAGLVIFSFTRESPLRIIEPINDWLLNLAQ